MLNCDMHPARRIFRSLLLVGLGASIMFFVLVVSLRVTFRNAPLDGPLQTKILQADILQFRTAAAFSNDSKDMMIINELLGMSFMSPLYYHEGMRMLKNKADDGYEPAVKQLAVLENPPVHSP